MSHPKNVDVSVEYKHDLQFPSVTICNHNMFRWAMAYSVVTNTILQITFSVSILPSFNYGVKFMP